jgi:hypothetical protein
LQRPVGNSRWSAAVSCSGSWLGIHSSNSRAIRTCRRTR